MASGYAHVLAALARPLGRHLEWAPGTRYVVDGATVVAVRRLVLEGRQEAVKRRDTLWTPGSNYGLILLVALILATPGWSRPQRARALGWGLAWVTLTQLALLLTRTMQTQLAPFETAYGPFTVAPPDYSRVARGVVRWLHGFLNVVGPGFFALLIYGGLVTAARGRAGRSAPGSRVGRNDPCACASGLKVKRRCGA